MSNESYRPRMHGKKMKAWILAGVLAGATIASTTVSADVKIYSGAECVALGTDQSDANYSNGRVFNNGTSYQGFYCPVVLDDYAIPESVYTWIYLLDRNITYDIFCNLRSQEPVSGSYYFKNTSTSDGSNDPVKKTFSGSSSYYSDGLRYVYCLIPGTDGGAASSGVVAYSVNEG